MLPRWFISTTSRCCLALVMATGVTSTSRGDQRPSVATSWSRHTSTAECRHALAVGANPAISNHFPEGNPAHSRWSSAATPPDRGVFQSAYPAGIAAFVFPYWSEGLESLRETRVSSPKPVVSLRSTTGSGLRPLRGGELCQSPWRATGGRSLESTDDAHQTEKLYDGQALDAWRERMKSLDLQSPEAAIAVPGLIAIVEDEAAPWFTRRQSALTLGRIGVPAARAVSLLERYAVAPVVEGDASPPLWAVKALALFGPVAARATPTLARLASDSSTDHSVRLMSIEALCRIGIAHPLALPTVITLLQSHEPRINISHERTGAELDLVVACIESLELFRGSGDSSVPVLLRYSEDRDERVRRAVAVTLGSIGPHANDAAARLAEMVVADRSLDVRDVAAVALGRVGGTDRLTRILMHREPETRERAAIGLGHAPSPDPATNEALATARADESPLVRIAALEATQRLRPNPQLTAPAAAKEIAAPNRSVRLRAIRFLAQLGSKAAPAIPELEQLRQHPDMQVRQSAEKLLEALREP